jgi:hypothetical protein
MEAEQKTGRPQGWTPDEVARQQRSERVRAERESRKSPQERLEDTLRLSRFVSELAHGAADDVRAR